MSDINNNRWRKDYQKFFKANPPASRCFVHETSMLSPLLLGKFLATAYSGCTLVVVPNLATAESVTVELRELFEMLAISKEVIFCPEMVDSNREFAAVSESSAQRSRALHALVSNSNSIVVSSLSAAVRKIVSPTHFSDHTLTISVGDTSFEPHTLAKKLLDLDYDNEFEVHVPGEYSLRGGILDLFSPINKLPARLDFFGNEIESIRLFSSKTQRSIESIDQLLVTPRSGVLGKLDSDLLDYVMSSSAQLMTVFPEQSREQLYQFYPELVDRYEDFLVESDFTVFDEFEDREDSVLEYGLFGLEPVLRQNENVDSIYNSLQVSNMLDQLKQWSSHYLVVCAFKSDLVKKNFAEFVLKVPGLNYVESSVPLNSGFIHPEARLVFLTDAEMQVSSITNSRRRLASQVRDYESDWSIRDDVDLENGDIVVHITYGIARYHGITEVEHDFERREVLELEFYDEVRIYVPMNQSHLVSRYIGQGSANPKLSRIGGTVWKNKKESIEEAVRDFAAELLRLQAVRSTVGGFQHNVEDEMQHLFESTFPFEPTVDQLSAFDDVKKDMEGKEPMDRLLCGDVGYGKTEVAIRAAFKAVMNGYQVAVVTPTTILTQQHFDSFSERMEPFPIVLDQVSRFCGAKKQKLALKAVEAGSVDIVIGTHRLLQKDVRFKNLGLVIVDEEQKFGVKHKEFLKRLRVSVDVLTMSATPIPRTLYMSLTGARDLSTINTPPKQRQAVRTIVSRFEDELIKEALERELERGGQIFVMHNRVRTIDQFAEKIQQLVPKAKIIIGHGQMPTRQLEDVMHKFQNHKADILVCTTIIENGVDVPNANTIVIDRADRFGLAELYQIRGRVGRSNRQAYAYFIIPPTGILSSNARERIAAIRKYTHLGAGFKLALRDLEIRGAGNILGSSQSGYIAAIGFDLYCELLRDNVNRLKNLPPEKSSFQKQCFVKLSFLRYRSYDREKDKEEGVFSASIPKRYMNAENLRLECYRRLSKIGSEVELELYIEELIDRFGKLPITMQHLISLTRLIILAEQRGIYSVVQRDDGRIFMETSRGHIKISGRIPILMSSKPKDQLNQMFKLIKSLPEKAK